MFLFSRKTKTPISTYSDSYTAPTSIKEVYKDPLLWAWEANKFVTPGLSQTMQHHANPEGMQKMVKCAVQNYRCKGSIPGHPYLPEKYWLCQEEANKCNRNYLCNDQYNTWRMGPYNCTGWNTYTTCLPRLPKEAGMETAVRGMPLEYPPKPERLNAYEHEVVVNMLNSLSRNQPLPQITPRCGCVDPLRATCPSRVMKAFAPAATTVCEGWTTASPGHLARNTTCNLWTRLSVLPYEHRAGMQCAVITSPLSYCPCPNLRWDTSHFKKTGGPQRNNYVIHPEFVSEVYTDYHC